MRRNLLFALALVAACAPGGERPAAIAYGEVNCDFCHMTLERERHAAQIVPATGTVKVFDEAGCLMRYVAMAEGRIGERDRLWVHDEASLEWIDARQAVFVVPAGPVPGMMYGVLAYRDRIRADEARAGARVTDFATYLRELRT